MRNNSKVEFSNTLADSVFLGMNECYRYGMTWGCDIDCPVLRSGKCEFRHNENRDLYQEFLKEQLQDLTPETK